MGGGVRKLQLYFSFWTNYMLSFKGIHQLFNKFPLNEEFFLSIHPKIGHFAENSPPPGQEKLKHLEK